MKHRAFIVVSIYIFIVTSAVILMSGDGKYVGKIGSVDSGKKEIIVNVEGGRTIKMGEQLYVRVGEEIVIMEATFPMQTTARCKLLRASAGHFNQLEKGMNVYKYDKAELEEKEDDTEKSSDKTGQIETIGGIEMVKLPGGTFTMGSPESEEERESDEKQHRVTVSPFWIGKYEVTQKQYEDVMGTKPSRFNGDNLPVELVSWYDAVEFCNKMSNKHGLKPYYKIDKSRKDPNNKSDYDDLKWTVTIAGGNGFRLPTEAEWEYACRAGTATAFCYGNSLDSSMANFNGNYPYNADKGIYREKTTAVGSFKPNAWGLYDMHGNVYEWCWDWYGEYGSDVIDPKGGAGGDCRVERGGGWFFNGRSLRSASRYRNYPNSRSSNLGFRLVRSAQ